ncbi:Cml5, partial [Symbiodinium microadriaticum]
VNIRNASPDDERDILTIFNEGHAVYRAKYPPVQSHMKQATKSIKAAMIAIGTSDTSHNKFWVAENVLRTKSGTSHEKGHRQGRETIGCVSMRKTTSTDKKGHDRDIGILSHLSVREECRGQGVGTALVQKIIGVAAADGCRAIELTTLADMKAARSLYVTLGFQERDVVDIGHGCKLVHMNMQL